VKAKTRKRLNRTVGRARRDLLGGKQKADRLYLNAANARAQNDLCLCGDEEIAYSNQAEADADRTREAAVCGACSKQKLRVQVIAENLNPANADCLTLAKTDLLK